MPPRRAPFHGYFGHRCGPVGLFLGFQCGMLRMRCHVVDALDGIGGRCTALYPEKPIYDVPAFPSVLAGDLVEHLTKQVEPFSPVFHLGEQSRNSNSLLTPGDGL